jgi:hypothetical protein
LVPDTTVIRDTARQRTVDVRVCDIAILNAPRSRSVATGQPHASATNATTNAVETAFACTGGAGSFRSTDHPALPEGERSLWIRTQGNRAPRCATARQERGADCERTNPVIVVNNTWTNDGNERKRPGPFTVNSVNVVNGQTTTVNVAE